MKGERFKQLNLHLDEMEGWIHVESTEHQEAFNKEAFDAVKEMRGILVDLAQEVNIIRRPK